jgi:hypothetical protein
MTIRFKILALAFVILVVFGVVVGISTWLQHQFMNQIVAITRYHIPLRTLIADFDVRTEARVRSGSSWALSIAASYNTVAQASILSVIR